MAEMMKKIFFLLAIMSLTACSKNLDLVGMFAGQSPQPDYRFDKSMEHNAAVGPRDLVLSSDDYRFYVGTDTHVDDKYEHTAQYLRDFRQDPSASFTLMLGDLINAQQNIPWVSEMFRDSCGTKRDRIYITLGNHDAYFNQWGEWQQEWGSSTYSFDVVTPNAKDLYICIESANGTLGNKQTRWLKELLEQSLSKGYRHKIIFTHTHMFKKDGSQGHTSNYAMEETYELTDLFSRCGVDWYLCGHDHCREITHHKGVTYIIVDALEEHYNNAFYMIADIGEQMHYTFVPVGEQD